MIIPTRNHVRRQVRTGAVSCAAFVLSAQLALAATDAVDPSTGTIRLVLPADPPTLDSARVTSGIELRILGHAMEGLVRYDAQNRIVPGVATHWEIVGTQATFHLRPEARWSDGSPVTADDFAFAWRRALDPNTASEYARILYPLKNARSVNTGEMPPSALGVRAVDDHTLSVQLEQPNTPHFETLLAFPTYLPGKRSFVWSRADRYGADAADLLSNGPFVVKAWVHGASLRLERNPHYWDRQSIHVNVIDYAYITSDTRSAVNLFRAGSIAMTGLDAEALETAQEQGWRIERFPTGVLVYLAFNHRPGRPTANRHLRKAIQAATDTDELVRRVIKLPGTVPGRSLFPRWLKFRNDFPAPASRVSLAAARQHLAAATEELGEIPTLTMLAGEGPSAKKQAEYLQEAYKNLGLTVKIDQQVFKERLAKMRTGTFDLVISAWGPDYADPLTYVDLVGRTPHNQGRYENPILDDWLATAEFSDAPHVRMSAFDEIQRLVDEEAVLVPLSEGGSVYVRDPRLTGIVRRSVGPDPDFRFVRIAPITD